MAITSMQMRAGVGWQYAMTDLSLILFLVTASALEHRPAAAKAPAQVPAPPPMIAEPVAVWREAPGAPALAEWLRASPRDPRERLTIVARYAGGDPAGASARAARLLASAGPAAGAVRLLVEPGTADELSATLTWDGSGDGSGDGAATHQGKAR